ncbi:hypothetical protein EJ08DRAFT_53199 [Tothia fuscella]|uniref:GDS1 winged helix domain-containing protein n=1 Tax=Tothia fuscella TaxID=1048955 RepID=A0A9P4TT44_9PEZI|nr:hypothetical protein EJ08DRAFT_53199 [Tothia fuscella]
MPYNTRRKSVSLASLGIHVPNSSRSSSHRSPPANTSAAGEEEPAPKKLKRSHTTGSNGVSPSSPSRHEIAKFKHERRKSAARVAERTPPPSPGEAGGFKIDCEGINDDIVVGVIEQLEKTGNRPHLLKELAAVLSNTLAVVESSANQSAIISSRLSTYLKRPWTALAPCPVGKELIGTHPKRIYFYLTTQPRQAFPDPVEIPANRIISPSLTSAENEEEDDKVGRRRSQLSPSPEVDLSSPELEDHHSPMAATDSFSNGHIVSHTSTHSRTTSLVHSRTSPPLERDEREFTQTATSLQQRRKSESLEIKAEDLPAPLPSIDEPMTEADESEERAAQRNEEAAAVLFGAAENNLSLPRVSFMESSPMLKPQMDIDKILLPFAKHNNTATYEMRDVQLSDDLSTFTCESLELDELDDLFRSY